MGRSDTVEQLRHDIDAGRTGGKVRGGDPAAAPLGTDEEAAGTPVPAGAISNARERERGHAELQEATKARERARRRRWTISAFVALAALVLLAVWMAP